MPKIAIYRHHLFRISETFIEAQAERLEGCEVFYVGRERFGNGPSNAESLALFDLPDHRTLRARLWQVLSRDPRPYLRLLDGRAPALIHAHFGVEGVYALPIARRLRIPLVTTFHGFDATQTSSTLLLSPYPSWWNYVLHRRQLARHGALFICVSEFIRRRVLALGFPEARTLVHYTGVDTVAIRPISTRSAVPTILHVARLVETKGTCDLIAAFARLVRQIPEARLRIVGEGPLEGALRSQADRLGVSSTVRFLGARPHPEVLKLISDAWVLALPSVTARSGQSEGLGMVLLEAAASGVPVVATLHNGIPEIVVDGVTGLLSPEHDVDALSEHLSELLRSASLRSRMGDAARLRVEQHFDVTRQSVALARVYNHILGSSSGSLP
jgi:glycosyltransferase involved in cell wall biosynthesis